MPRARAAEMYLTIVFLALIGSAGLIQTAAELRDGVRPGALELFDRPPSARNLREFEQALDRDSLVMGRLRPWMQDARFSLLADAGEKAVVGRNGWLFYGPSVRYATERPESAGQKGQASDPLPAIQSFHDHLSARGIRLIIVPVPNKESIYPEMLSRRAVPAGVVVCRPTRSVLDRLRQAGIEVVNLFEAFRQAKDAQSPTDRRRFYLEQDSHWTPEGVVVAVKAVARQIRERGETKLGNVEYDVRPGPVERLGDLLQMLRVPRIERATVPEHIACEQVVRRDNGRLYQDAPDSTILVLGDSFLRIYEQDAPRAAGFVAHLARALGQPLSSLQSDGGASTLVRQELNRRPRLLVSKSLVIWEFVERDIREGTEGWQVIPLPEAVTEQGRDRQGTNRAP
jgi:alginate O-acetyltransferase complex protein AlgJ